MPNRLIAETSPYLRQHAENPVDWFPWGDEAFEKARREDKPVFLSVGYSACHWCHVMEHESFEDEATAALMNEYFVSVKVDREERPDVDAIYMDAVQALTGSGGWPMSVFLTPDAVPFYGGTYFPDTSRYGMPSFSEVLRQIAALWANRRDEILEAGAALKEELERQASGGTSTANGTLERETLDAAVRGLSRVFDRLNGGWGGAPKFPQPAVTEFVLRRYQATGRRTPAGDGDVHARRDDAWRHLRPARRRVPPVRDRRAMARAALREDALRQRTARAPLPARLADHRRRVLPPRGDRDPRLRREGVARPGRRLLLGAGRRLGGRRGPVLRLDTGTDTARHSRTAAPDSDR